MGLFSRFDRMLSRIKAINEQLNEIAQNILQKSTQWSKIFLSS